MDYFEALRYLQARDDWERTGSLRDAAHWDLRRMRSLLARLGDPHLGRKTIHVAGSKGKGSTAAMIAWVLRAAPSATLRAGGQRVGLYTSPHLHRFTERVAVDGEPIAREEFGRLLGALTPHIEAEDTDGRRPPAGRTGTGRGGRYGSVSTFEALTALAFLHFRERDVRWQVLEVGLGGRLDATNVLDQKEVCVITPIGLEHTAVLGDTVAQIAGEKAAIITPGTTVVLAPQRESAAEVVRRVCAERGATLIEVAQACALSRNGHSSDGQDFTLRTPRATYRLHLPLLGRHQLDNAATAVLALEAPALHGVEVSEPLLRAGLAGLRWPARIEIIKRRPLVVVDGAHDRDSARCLARTLREELGLSHALCLVGTLTDKNVEAIAQEMAPLASAVVAPSWEHPRAMAAQQVATAFASLAVPVTSGCALDGAVDGALAQVGPDGAVCAFGSLAFAARVREHLLGIEYDPPLAPAPPVGAEAQEMGV